MTMLKCRPHGAVQTIFEVEVAVPFNDMGEQVAKICRILVEQSLQIEVRVRRDEFVKVDLRWGYFGPLAVIEPMVGVGTPRTHSLEDHPAILDIRSGSAGHQRPRGRQSFGALSVGVCLLYTSPSPRDRQNLVCRLLLKK